MLQITISGTEQWDEKNQEFVYTNGQTLTLEHSLISISKWESKWCKAFLSKKEKTYEETLDYIKCMTLTPNIDPQIYNCLTPDIFEEINNYIGSPMTATVFYENNKGPANHETVTSELIYYWMIALNIPFECQKWHLNRLLTLIRVCNIKNAPPKKMGKNALMRRNASLNAARRKNLNTRG